MFASLDVLCSPRGLEDGGWACSGMYLANQLDGKIFNDPSLLPSKTSYEKFLQTKVWAPPGILSWLGRSGRIIVPSGSQPGRNGIIVLSGSQPGRIDRPGSSPLKAARASFHHSLVSPSCGGHDGKLLGLTSVDAAFFKQQTNGILRSRL